MILLYRLLLFLGMLGIMGSTHPLEKRMSLPSINRLKLYAYGGNIGGLPLFFADGIVQIGDPKLSKAAMKTPMCVRIPSGNQREPSMWMADVDGEKVSPAQIVGFIIDGILASTSVLALSESSTFLQTSATLKSDAYAKPVVFTSATITGSQTGMLTDVWYLYGSFVLLNVPGAAFYAQPTDTDGLYNLMWSTSKMASLNSIPITIKTTGPVTGPAQMITGA